MPDQPDLYALLGVPRDTPIDRLRAVYEKHVDDAVRSHNFKRATTLSAAYDALPANSRRNLYSGNSTAAATPAPAPTKRKAPKTKTATARPRGQWRRKALTWTIVLAVSGGLLALAIENKPTNRYQTPNITYGPSTPANLIASEPDHVDPGVDGVFEVPIDAPTDVDGMVRVGCEAGPSGPVTYTYASPGQEVSCPDGSPPIFP